MSEDRDARAQVEAGAEKDLELKNLELKNVDAANVRGGDGKVVKASSTLTCASGSHIPEVKL